MMTIDGLHHQSHVNVRAPVLASVRAPVLASIGEPRATLADALSAPSDIKQATALVFQRGWDLICTQKQSLKLPIYEDVKFL